MTTTVTLSALLFWLRKSMKMHSISRTCKIVTDCLFCFWLGLRVKQRWRSFVHLTATWLHIHIYLAAT